MGFVVWTVLFVTRKLILELSGITFCYDKQGDYPLVIDGLWSYKIQSIRVSGFHAALIIFMLL